VKVPFSRLAKLNKPEWGYAIVGCVGSAGVGTVQPIFAYVISTMVGWSVLGEPQSCFLGFWILFKPCFVL